MDDVDRALREYGLLLQQDKTLPSVAGIIAGEPLSTSWWSHPKGRAIFTRVRKLEDEVLVTRLIGGKVTYVHEQLWPAFLAIAMSNASWQRDGLPADASNRELQQRLLVAAREVHTESGKHEMEVESWESWAKRHGAAPMKDIDAARDEIERAVTALGAPLSSLPWRRNVVL